ncbi:vitamin K epoxide reductase family protein [Bacteroides sp.]|uniref:vitamin K epoxide reductase family protein n=1 Tax=Bacteroides sp. TaxID=29523 RepID=UPI0026DFEEEB|nr:vitamin K epoxide reductase family protein [Bacteroides sp.]
MFIEQIDKYNIHIKRLCSSNESKIDCSSILDFKDAYFMGLISWSDIGFVYFTFLLILLLVLPFSTSQAFINILSLFSIGYVCYSLFYQKIIAQKWCTLCLSVQAVFIFLFILSICTATINDIHELLKTESIMDIIIIFLITTSAYAVTKPLIASQKEYTVLKKKFNELIYDENITQYLFQQELQLTDIDKIDKLSIGNADAETCITMVFSPICVSCIKELQTLIPILQRKNNIKLNLIFLLDRKKHPESLVIAKYLLSDYQNIPKEFITTLQKYVDDYPISKNKIMRNTKFLQERSECDSYINAQEKWCRSHKLYSTPILFINGNKLPSYYNIKDIDYLYN